MVSVIAKPRIGPVPNKARSTARTSSTQLPRRAGRARAPLARAAARATAARRKQAAPRPPDRARRRRRSRTGAARSAAALRFVDWLEPLLRRESYLALLVERPEVQNRLLRLLGLARWPMRYLMRHPGVIDELADERLLHDRFDRATRTSRELEERHAGWERSGQADEELAARHAAPRPPRRGLPHAGARRRGPHHRRAGRRRPVGAGRRDALTARCAGPGST